LIFGFFKLRFTRSKKLMGAILAIDTCN
jgi:hypothetical protein